MTFTADGRGCRRLSLSNRDAAREFFAQRRRRRYGRRRFLRECEYRPQVRQFISLLTRLAREIGGAVTSCSLILAERAKRRKRRRRIDRVEQFGPLAAAVYLRRPGPAGRQGKDAEDDEEIDIDARILSRLKADYATAGVDLALRFDRAIHSGGRCVPRMRRAGPGRDREAEKTSWPRCRNWRRKAFVATSIAAKPTLRQRRCARRRKLAAVFGERTRRRAMNRLLKGGRIASIEEGPASRRRSRLQVIAPDLPET